MTREEYMRKLADIQTDISAYKQEPSGDLIRRQDAIKAIDEKAKRIKNEDTLNGLAGAVGILFDLPSYNSIKIEPSGDVISRQAVLETLDDMDNVLDEDRTIENYKELLKECYEVLPSVKPQEPKTGHWISMWTEKQIHIKDGIVSESIKCSECDEWLTASDEYDCYGRYCPNCGCRMVEPQKRSDKE